MHFFFVLIFSLSLFWVNYFIAFFSMLWMQINAKFSFQPCNFGQLLWNEQFDVGYFRFLFTRYTFFLFSNKLLLVRWSSTCVMLLCTANNLCYCLLMLVCLWVVCCFFFFCFSLRAFYSSLSCCVHCFSCEYAIVVFNSYWIL